MTHGPGVALVAGTGAVVWLRRGWRPAAFQVLPLAVVFLGWAVVEHPMTSSGERAISEVLRFAGTMPVRARVGGST